MNENTNGSFIDFYEILQISPKADGETIHRVYRLLALRYHPDNRETGDQSTFEDVLKAYRVLSDPEARAAYDVKHSREERLRWKIFDQSTSLHGREIEKRQRSGILSLLYTKRMRQSHKPGMTPAEMEALLDCAREHLEFSLWYLYEKGLIRRADDARFVITAEGVDAGDEQGQPLREDRMLPAPRKVPVEARPGSPQRPAAGVKVANGHRQTVNQARTGRTNGSNGTRKSAQAWSGPSSNGSPRRKVPTVTTLKKASVPTQAPAR